MQQKVGVNSGYANTCQSRHPEGFDKMFSELVSCQIQQALMMPSTNYSAALMSYYGFKLCKKVGLFWQKITPVGKEIHVLR